MQDDNVGISADARREMRFQETGATERTKL